MLMALSSVETASVCRAEASARFEYDPHAQKDKGNGAQYDRDNDKPNHKWIYELQNYKL